ncbi:YbfB/YjiJ family MFS transporter [Hoeflea prorocentri]|uniref:YbfB/YjiJ family MFS transporter n=1 Tax=Hoeflea prorocentri TaxID=1922333 RepID=A0A9X3UJ78_9HYPH|nr:YbfB/YjiJ family MFS transporter [Hoeflea prorocentri]MCY6381622.1 YbfB/YjiJ family MFS transporter [Hoeflea prorocentri]MDA5399422.1 YbfB/YjiJ family MFS transporter [Hoeflea prorocentri]
MSDFPLRITLIGFGCLALAMGIGRFAFTPLLPMMQTDGLLGLTSGGALASIHFLGYWLGAMWAAGRRLPPKRALRLSLFAIAASTLGMGLTGDIIVWSVLRFLAGFFSALTLVLVSSYYVKRLAETGRLKAQGWIFSGVGAGIALAGLAAMAFMVGGVESAPAWVVLGAFSVTAAVALSLGLGSEIEPAPHSQAEGGKGRAPLQWAAITAYGAAGLGYIVPATYLPVMAREIIASPLVFGWAWPVFGASAFLSTLLAARLQARYTNRQIWILSQLVMAFGLILPVAYSGLASIIIAGICVGGTFMIITMMGMKEAHRVAPPADVMRHIGVLTAAFAFGQMVGPVLAGAVSALTGSFAVALALTCALLVVTACALALAAGSEGKEPVSV